MSNLQNNVETPMMEPRRPKKDAIQKRIRKLKIGIYTSFILSLVAIAISIVLLTKVQKLEEEMATVQTEISKIPTDQVKKLYSKFHELESTLENLKENVMNHNVKSGLRKNDTTVLKSLPPVSDDNDNSDNSNDDLFNDMTHDEELKVEADNIGLVDSIDVVEIGNSDDAEDVHSHHSHHGTHDMTDDGDLPMFKTKLCQDENNDDSDLCDEVEGSGDVGDSDNEDIHEGSGHHPDCIQFPRPVCPPGHKICYTKNQTSKCPVPICCKDS